MPQIPHPGDQARILREFLAANDLALAHQLSLEAVALTMGHKNWKTMSAHAGEQPAAGEDTGNTAAFDVLGLTEDDFDPETASFANNMGMGGEFSVISRDGQYLLQAWLDSNEPDNSDDELRSQCTLSLKLSYAPGQDLEGTGIQTIPWTTNIAAMTEAEVTTWRNFVNDPPLSA